MTNVFNFCLLALFAFAAIASGQTHGPSLPAGQFADLPGTKLWYFDTGGKGVPIVLLHATTGTSSSWEKQIHPFVMAGFRVIAFDRRGWGRSTNTGSDTGTASADLNALLDHLKLGRIHLVGTAAGGFVAIDFALSYPNRLRSLVLAATIGGITDEEYVQLGTRLRPAPFTDLPAALRELGPAFRAADKEGSERWAAMEEASRPPGPRLPAQPMQNKITFANLEKIQTAALLLSGGADMYAPAPVMQMLARRIHGSQFVNVPDSGHSIFWEAPDRFNAEVLRFIRKH